MKPKQAELFKSVRNKQDLLPPEKPEIALVGRSNVGKSSLLNVLVQRRNLARTSGTPGKTRAVHYYCIDERFFIVDLPGYGYARASKEEQRAWSELVEAYLEQRIGHALLLQLVDLRHAPSTGDLQMAAWIRHFALPFRVVATKADKLPRGRKIKQRKVIASALQISPEEMILFSARTGEGKDELWKTVLSVLEPSR